MYSCMNPNEGIPARLYRSPGEIHRDMIRISAKIRENEEMLSVHNLLIEMIPTWAEQSPEKWLPELEATVAEALDALEKDNDYLTAGGVFPIELINNFIKAKRTECSQISQIPHPVEFEKYYNL